MDKIELPIKLINLQEYCEKINHNMRYCDLCDEIV